MLCWRSVPPAPCTMHLGTPVVPEEYRMYTGWSNGMEANSNWDGHSRDMSSSHTKAFSGGLAPGFPRCRTRTTVSMEEMGPALLEDDTLFVFTDRKKAPQESLLQKELREKIHNSVSSLPDIYRNVLYLRDVQGYSTKEAGRLLRLTPAAVKSRLHRSRLLLRESLKDYYCEN